MQNMTVPILRANLKVTMRVIMNVIQYYQGWLIDIILQ